MNKRIVRTLFFFILVIIIVALWKCSQPTIDDSRPQGLTTDILLRYTPIKDQGQSELCWAFAMLATIETEHLEQGDSVNLSTDFIGRKMLEEQSKTYFHSHGEYSMSMRGVGPMLIRIIRRYGAMPHDSYYSYTPVNYKVLQKKVQLLLDRHIRLHSSWEKCHIDLESLLDKEIGYLPRFVFMLGAQYTPLEFAHSVCRKDEYSAYCSNSSKAYGKAIDPQLTDNQYHHTAINVPQDSIKSLILQSLTHHHPVFWEGGPNDNHAVSIIGLGHNSDGKRFFIAKNSWGTDNPTNGFLYIPVNYVKKHTALIVLHNN